MSAACDEGYVLHRCQSVTDDTFKQILSLEKKCFTKADSWRGMAQAMGRGLSLEMRRRRAALIPPLAPFPAPALPQPHACRSTPLSPDLVQLVPPTFVLLLQGTWPWS